MSSGLQRGQRLLRSPKRRLGQFLNVQVSTPEAVLAAVAVVLVVWLLWPEERGPKLESRVAQQDSVEKGERRRAELRPLASVERAEDVAAAAADRVRTAAAAPESVAAPERRITRPSEFADRVADRTVQPAPKKPFAEVNGPSEVNVASEEGQEAGPNEGLIPPDAVKAALTEIIDRIKENPKPGSDPSVLTSIAELGEDLADPQALSSDTLVTEPLPEVDLSDLDTLVPEPSEIAPSEPKPSETEPVETEVAALDAALPDQSGLASGDIAPAKPFIVEPSSLPAVDVRARARDDAPTWLRHAVATAVDDERPIIAIVIDDLGLNRQNTALMNGLPAPLTLAFLPYAGRIEAQTKAAQDAGHELMLHMPMEPVGSDWPGPDALTTKIDQAEFIKRLVKNLDRFEGFVGINNHMGSRLTADSPRMAAVMQELRKRDVLFLDSKTSARSVAGDIAGRNGVPNTTRDIFLDNVNDVTAIKRQLARAERVALQAGSAVAIGHPYDATIQALRDWLPSLEARGFALAPISAVVARRACKSGVLIAAETCDRYLPAAPKIASKQS